ncbi:hypothetical protein JOB18_005486 [Solea senegalensis]|uniref:Apolipoprotein M n=1 Tax=Solea senegalensis TaxID=28829 RepID=A0AAV6Q911_SOLSE|nr:hypothetical protein JOB18_005486 [Solea senegalensis]
MFAVFVAVLCLVSVSHSSLACEDLLRPSDQLDSDHLEGRWNLVAGSLKNPAAAQVLKGLDSVTIDYSNSSYFHTHRNGSSCTVHHHEITLDGHIFSMPGLSWNFTGTLFSTCPDCLVAGINIDMATSKSLNIYLFSRRREVTQKEMEDFKAQADCLKLPPPVVMDPNKETCPKMRAIEKTEEEIN